MAGAASAGPGGAVLGAASSAGASGVPGEGGLGSRRPGWVAFSEAEYVALAVSHAADVAALAALRVSLRERMLASPLCDGPAFVRRLEDLYRALWRRWVGGCWFDTQRTRRT